MSQVRHSHVFTQFVLFFALSAVSVAIFITLHPIVLLYFSERFLGGSYGDGGLYVWLARLFIEDPHSALALETNGMYPYPRTRAWSDTFLLPSAVMFALTEIGMSFAAAYNTVLLSAIGGIAGASYLLARRLGLQHLFAVASAITVSQGSYFVGNIGHPQLLFFLWVPLAWALALPEEHMQRAPTRGWLLAGLAVTAAFYCGVYYAIFAVIGLGVIWVSEVITGRASPRRSLRTLLAASIGAAPILYALPAYRAVQGYFGTRGSYEAEAFAARGVSYLSFSPFHALYAHTASWSHSEAYLGAGLVILLLAVVGAIHGAFRLAPIWAAVGGLSLLFVLVASSIVDNSNTNEWLLSIATWGVLLSALGIARRAKRFSQAVWIVVVAVFFVFSFGPGGNVVKGEPAYTPLAIAFDRMPGLSAVRAVGRFGSVVILAITIQAGFAPQSFIMRRGRAAHGMLAILSAAALCGVGVADNLIAKLPYDAPPPAPQAVNSFAERSSTGEVAMILPWVGSLHSESNPHWSEFAQLHATYAQWSTTPKQFETVNGYSGQRSKVQMLLARDVVDFPSERAFYAIGALCGVGTVLITPEGAIKFQGDTQDSALTRYSRFIEQTERFEDGSVLVDLKRIPLPVRPGGAVTFFGPRDGAISFAMSAVSDDQCNVSVSSLGRSEKGTPVPLQTERISLTKSQELRVEPPRGLSLASPHLVQIQVEGCDLLEVSCARPEVTNARR